MSLCNEFPPPSSGNIYPPPDPHLTSFTPITWLKNLQAALHHVDDQLSPDAPYVVTLRREAQHMTFVGLRHAGDDLAHGNYDVLREAWERFDRDTDGLPRVALYEGRRLRSIPTSEDEALTLGREAPLIAHWAKRSGIPAIPGEPPRHEIGAHLLGEFDPAHVYYFYLARQLSQYPRVRKEVRPPLEQYLQQTYDSFYLPLRKWEHFDGTRNRLLGWFAMQHEALFGTSFDPKDTGFFLEQIVNYSAEPIIQSPIQEVAAECNAFRDLYLMHVYHDYKRKGVSMFDARGWPHIYALDNFIYSMAHSVQATVEASGPSFYTLVNNGTLSRLFKTMNRDSN